MTTRTQSPMLIPENLQRRFLRLPQVMVLTGLKRSTIYLYVSEKKFPPPVKLGARCSAWDSEAINEWIAARLNGEVGAE